MKAQVPANPVLTGDIDGRDRLYSRSGALVGRPGEVFLGIAEGWDMNVRRPWRRILPGILFMGFNGKVVSRLYVTSSRIVLIREIDTWRQLAGEMTPLGIPTAVAKETQLKQLKEAGVRQYCELHPGSMRLVSARRFIKHGSRLDLQLMGDDGQEYAVSFWKTDGNDDQMLSLLETRFRR